MARAASARRRRAPRRAAARSPSRRSAGGAHRLCHARRPASSSRRERWAASVRPLQAAMALPSAESSTRRDESCTRCPAAHTARAACDGSRRTSGTRRPRRMACSSSAAAGDGAQLAPAGARPRESPHSSPPPARAPGPPRTGGAAADRSSRISDWRRSPARCPTSACRSRWLFPRPSARAGAGAGPLIASRGPGASLPLLRWRCRAIPVDVALSRGRSDSVRMIFYPAFLPAGRGEPRALGGWELGLGRSLWYRKVQQLIHGTAGR